jgi:hypothetical protein
MRRPAEPASIHISGVLRKRGPCPTQLGDEFQEGVKMGGCFCRRNTRIAVFAPLAPSTVTIVRLLSEMSQQGWNNLRSVAYWLVLGSQAAIVLLAWQLLRHRWVSEQRRRSALLAMSLLTTLILFSLYGRYAPKVLPQQTTSDFVIILKIVSGLSDAIGWLLSAFAIAAVVVWRRSSKHLASGFALGAGVWMCLWWTMALVSAVLAD